MSKRRKNAGEGYGYMFSGAFAKKADAVAKEKTRKGSFVKFSMTQQGPRYLVMTPRTNPIKRKRKNYNEAMDWANSTQADWKKKLGTRAKAVAAYRKMNALAAEGKHARSDKIRMQLAKLNARLGWTMADVATFARENPMDLMVMGANPATKAHKHFPAHTGWHAGAAEKAYAYADQLRAKYPGRQVDIRERSDGSWDVYLLNEPASNPRYGTCRKCGEAHNLVGGFCSRCRPDLHREYYGRNPGAEISAQPGETITIRVNPEPRENLYLGFGASHPSRRQLAASRRAFKTDVRRRIAEDRAEFSRLRRSARGSFKGKKKLESLFHEVYGQNPAICGARIGGYICSRKPGHRGPHLPQGATLRPRSRHKWGPRGNPDAAALREEFTGREVDRVSEFNEPHMPHGKYALLGKLLALYVKPRSGGQVQTIRPEGGTLVVADESARQLWFVGGDQDISGALDVFGAHQRSAGLFELGEARRIDYKQRKEHVPHPEVDEWRHEFGEESGVLPMVLFDVNAKRLLLEGGEYKVRPEGIVN